MESFLSVLTVQTCPEIKRREPIVPTVTNSKGVSRCRKTANCILRPGIVGRFASAREIRGVRSWLLLQFPNGRCGSLWKLPVVFVHEKPCSFRGDVGATDEH